ncbi:hypothetical protein BDV98DRAFT_542413 [Pterulicium gracile]|uniref:RING-type E3 ubiquitin transferase n=1 Tax=Pterulicium gracile TaxID=1884261 RepID=A0A5C3QVJ9_9AGAR|nr:hypothetical protein BDV98DRAFT_542413 [Pterula gracilis]
MPEGQLRRGANVLASSLGSHKLWLYALVSTVAVSAAITNALQSYNNFYSIMVFLSKSSRSVVVLANFGVLTAFISGRIIQQVFFGPLRPTEVERLYDRLWFFVTESLLTFTIFREDFDIPFGLMFGFLLFMKSFHWLASDRVEWMEQRPYPGPPLLFHFRMNALFFLLGLVDTVMFLIAIESTLTHGVGGMVLFASEYAVLLASIGNTVAKYLLTAYELRRAGQHGGEMAPPWEAKSMWIFYLELITDFLKLSTYLLFFTVIVSYYGFPLSIIRDIYVTARSFINRLRALHRYQNATRNMDQKYPSATEEEMPSDRTCIICREEMVLSEPEANGQSHGPNTTPKKLPCGHIFHFYCLRSWLERQQSCPTCRRSVLEATPAAPRAQQDGQPPRPQGAPQGHDQHAPPNPAGNAAGAAAQPANAPNRGNLMDRVLHIAGAPPLVPGQFAPGPVGAFAPIAQPPHEVVIQYRIQYGNANRQNPPAQINAAPPAAQALPQQAVATPAATPAEPPQLLRPAPRIAAFQDQAGNQIPWDMDERWFQPQPPNNDATTTPALEATPTPTVPSVPTNSHNAEGSSTADAPTATESAGSSNPGSSEAADPREAGRQAALRRHGSAQPSAQSPSPATQPPIAPTTPAPAEPSSVPSTSASAQSMPFSIPALIPLSDHHELKCTVHPAIPSTPAPIAATSSQPRRIHRTRDTTPLSQLPAIMTEEQLLVIDQLSREGIDERLRVLDNVSGTINRCIEELLKLRSSLPRSSKPKSSAAENETDFKDKKAAPQVTISTVDEQQPVVDTAEPKKPKEKVDLGAGKQEENGPTVLPEVITPKVDEQQPAADTTKLEKSENQTEDKVELGAEQQEEKKPAVLAQGDNGHAVPMVEAEGAALPAQSEAADKTDPEAETKA